MKTDNTQSTIGIIGGSGIYALDKLTDAQWIDVESSFGKPSDSILIGFINDSLQSSVIVLNYIKVFCLGLFMLGQKL